jgi:AraC-like DNA-binding protein
MLTYLSGGTRRYGEAPVRIYARPYWEFQAVHSGAIAPTFPDPGSGDAESPAERALWVFPPGAEHGWTGRPGKPATISVFHFDALAEPAASFIRRQGHLRVGLDGPALERVAALETELAALRSGGDSLAVLKFEAACLELAILALGALGPARTAPLLDRAELAAAGASAWYSEHMAERPGLEEVARAMNCSVSHFRRLYRRARGEAPAAAFEALRTARARELLRRGDVPVKEVAALCGYEDQGSFSRAFRRAAGTTPRDFARKSAATDADQRY